MTQHTTTTRPTVPGASVSRFGAIAGPAAESCRTTACHGYVR